MSNDIFKEASSFAKEFEKLTDIQFVKSNENLWTDFEIEISTSLDVPHLTFKISTDETRELGLIEEVWYWDEEWTPTPIIYPDLMNFKQGVHVSISFEDVDDEEGGKNGTISA